MSERLSALVVAGTTDMHHDWRSVTPLLASALRETGRFEVRVTEKFRGAGAETLAGYDVVVLNVSRPTFRGLFTRGTEWAAGAEVTIPLPTAFGEPVEGGDRWPTGLESRARADFEALQAGGS